MTPEGWFSRCRISVPVPNVESNTPRRDGSRNSVREVARLPRESERLGAIGRVALSKTVMAVSGCALVEDIIFAVELFGKRLMDPSQMATSFITATRIRWMTDWKIFS